VGYVLALIAIVVIFLFSGQCVRPIPLNCVHMTLRVKRGFLGILVDLCLEVRPTFEVTLPVKNGFRVGCLIWIGRRRKSHSILYVLQ